MSVDLETQLASYFDSEATAQQPISVVEVEDLARPLDQRKRPVRRRGWLIALASAAVVTLLLGLIPVLTSDSDSLPSDPSVVPPTVPPSTTPSTVPPVETGAPPPLEVERIALEAVEAQLGEFSWTRVDGDPETLPLLWAFYPGGINAEADPFGDGYRAWDPIGSWAWGNDVGVTGHRVWRSPDGITWAHNPTSSDTRPERLKKSNAYAPLPRVTELPGGGFALFDGLASHWLETGGEHHAQISDDGMSWEPIVPSFVGPDFAGADVWRNYEKGILEATVHTYKNGESEPVILHSWESRDGAEWTRKYRHPAASIVHETELGLISASVDAFQISLDNGESWAPLPRPDLSEAVDCQTSSGAFADIVFYRCDVVNGSDAGTRILYIGRFVPQPGE